jgi:hypothetical protein
MHGSGGVLTRLITRMTGWSRPLLVRSWRAMCGTGLGCLPSTRRRPAEMPNLLPMVALSLRAVRHLEVGAGVPDGHAGTSHRAIEPDSSREPRRRPSGPVGCSVTSKPEQPAARPAG